MLKSRISLFIHRRYGEKLSESEKFIVHEIKRAVKKTQDFLTALLFDYSAYFFDFFHFQNRNRASKAIST